MKKITLLAFAILSFFTLQAQEKAPKWVKKSAPAVVSVNTYDAAGTKLRTGTAVVTSANGEALADYALFKDAARAVITTQKGIEYPVAAIIGADDFYDVIKIKIDFPKKQPFATLATAKPAAGSAVIMLPYSDTKQPAFKAGTIKEVTTLKDTYSYYELNLPLVTTQLSAPIFTDAGELIGLAQADAQASTTRSFAISAAYVNSLRISASDAFNKSYTSIGIRKVWPASVDDALVMLFVLSGTQSPAEKLVTLTDFIETFPQSQEGYINRASHYAYARKQLETAGKSAAYFLEKATDDIETALSKADNKAEVLYNQANLIYNLAASDSLLQSAAWSIEHALEVLDEALAIDAQPQYNILKGDIKFYQQKYDEALAAYNIVNSSDQATHGSYYWAAKAKQQLPNVNVSEVIALLDSAVISCGAHFQKEAAHYVLERVALKTDLGLFKEIVADYDLYYTLVKGEVADVFYYYREQAKFRLGDLDGAMQDINEALKLSPKDATYLAEKAAIQVRLKDYEAALQSIDAALVLDPTFAACYRLRAVCYIRLKQPANVCAALTKAVELGDPVAVKLKKQHCK